MQRKYYKRQSFFFPNRKFFLLRREAECELEQHLVIPATAPQRNKGGGKRDKQTKTEKRQGVRETERKRQTERERGKETDREREREREKERGKS